MKRNTPRALLLAVLCLPAATALGQYRIDNSQARDANNRVGSGGFNSGAQLNGRINGLAGNYIVTGNVTGGRAFRGSLGYTDSTSFRGSLGSASFDSFVRDSIGAAQMRGTWNAGSNVATIQPQPFFGNASVAPPVGFARDPSSGAFYLPRTSPGVTAADGRIDYGGATRADIQQGVLASQRVSGGPGLIYTPFGSLNQREQLTNINRMSDFTTIARSPIPVLGDTVNDPGVTVAGPRLPQVETPERPAATEGSEETPSATDPVSLTGQGTVYKNLRALDNNSQYAELRKRFDDKSNTPKLPGSETVESLNKMNAEILANRKKEAEAAQPNEGGTDRKPANPIESGTGGGAGGAPANTPKPPETPPAPLDNLNLPRPEAGPAVTPPSAPLEINSLAAGVKDRNLAKVLSEAETSMKQGKFSSAIDAFERAEQLAADDPLVFMGRSIAELGGGYYRSAEIHFRQAFAADPALLLAKFDLRSMLTDERLNALQLDLAQIAKKNEKDPGPLLLLAFIYYNTGFPERSERALEMVQERANNADNEAKLLKEAWFPSSTVPQNK